MCYSVVLVHIKDPLVLTEKIAQLVAAAGFLSNWVVFYNMPNALLL